ncbi:MAG: sensor histidine kinase [Bdellovibrionales bacterium]
MKRSKPKYVVTVLTLLISLTVSGVLWQVHHFKSFFTEAQDTVKQRLEFDRISLSMSFVEVGVLLKKLDFEVRGEGFINQGLSAIKDELDNKNLANDTNLDHSIKKFLSTLTDFEKLEASISATRNSRDRKVLDRKIDAKFSELLFLQDRIYVDSQIVNNNLKDKISGITDKHQAALLHSSIIVGLSLSGVFIVLFFTIRLVQKSYAREDMLEDLLEKEKGHGAILEKAKNELLRTQKMLDKASKFSSIGEVAGSLGHELNNHLAVVNGWSDRLQREISKEEPRPEVIEKSSEKIQKAVKKLEKITSSYRKYSRNSVEDPMELVRLKNVVEESIEIVQAKLKTHGVALKTFVGSDVSLECSPIELSQVLINLVNNAIDEITGSEKPWVQIRGIEVEGEGLVEISVTDSGCGIPQDIVDQLFDPYYTTKSREKGTGIGLSISKKIIDAHNGDIEVDTKFVNTRFVIRLPKRQPPEAAALELSAEAS